MTLAVVPRVNPLPAPQSASTGLSGLLGGSPAMQRLRAEVLRYAPRSATVLVLGETGTGKELVAHALHVVSARAAMPFVAVNVATLRRELLTTELFGHERGAFTQAVARHRGVFEQAHGGSLFLDEIGELDITAQADLLRVLETGEIRPVGAERSRTVDVRLIAATHRDLAALVAEGRFRADLFYRLHILPVTVPSLRERREDLPLLVRHLLARLRSEVGERHLALDAFALLDQYPWPGNVRQLLNVLRRACAQSDAPTLDRDTMFTALAVEPPSPGVNVRREVSAAVMAEALHRTGSLSGAARELGVARSTLRYRLKAARTGP